MRAGFVVVVEDGLGLDGWKFGAAIGCKGARVGRMSWDVPSSAGGAAEGAGDGRAVEVPKTLSSSAYGSGVGVARLLVDGDWLMFDGRRTNGLCFSGDSFEGEDCVGVVALIVAGDPLFWRLNGD